MQGGASITGVDHLLVEDRPGSGIEYEQPMSVTVRDSDDE